MAIDHEYLKDIVAYLNEHKYSKFCFPHSGKKKFWWDLDSNCHEYVVVDIAPENIPKFVEHLKYIIDLRDPQHPQVEFKDHTFTEFKTMASWEEYEWGVRWMGLPKKQKGL